MECMILLIVVLFTETRNAVPEVQPIILERLFASPTYEMWYPADPRSPVSSQLPVAVFPRKELPNLSMNSPSAPFPTPQGVSRW